METVAHVRTVHRGGHFTREALNDLGRYLIAGFDGRFAHLVEATQGSAERLVGLLARMEFFADVETWRGVEVPLANVCTVFIRFQELCDPTRGSRTFESHRSISSTVETIPPSPAQAVPKKFDFLYSPDS